MRTIWHFTLISGRFIDTNTGLVEEIIDRNRPARAKMRITGTAGIHLDPKNISVNSGEWS
jgi:hypothetical protein